MKLTDVIRRPLVTEKTTLLREDGRSVVFEVARSANKIDVKRAIEKVNAIKSSRDVATEDHKDRFFGRGRYARL